MTNLITRRATQVLFGLALVGLVAAAPGNANVDTERTVELTFSKPIALPGVTLGAGTYIFERAAPLSSIEVVRVSSRDRRHVYFAGFTLLVEKPRGTTSPITFGEAPAGSPLPIREWYPTGTSTGHRFVYR
jgi:hypothetical protein